MWLSGHCWEINDRPDIILLIARLLNTTNEEMDSKRDNKTKYFFAYSNENIPSWPQTQASVVMEYIGIHLRVHLRVGLLVE